MAKNLQVTYPGKTITGDPLFPYGKPKNVNVNGDGTGTPFEAEWASDIAGFFQHLLVNSNTVPSNLPDNAEVSQYMEAIKSITFKDGVRVFEDIDELLITKVFEGDVISIKSLSYVQMEIMPSSFSPLGGDITLEDGKVATIVLQPVNDVRWWGAGQTSDDTSAVQNAFSRLANTYLTLYNPINLQISGRLYAPNNMVFAGGEMTAVSNNWASNTADATTNTVGLPIMTLKSGFTLKDMVIDCGLSTIGTGIAASGLFINNSTNTSTANLTLVHYNGYAHWARSKNTDSTHDNITCSQWLWGEAGWYDVNLRTAVGIANSSGDNIYTRIISYYNKYNIYCNDSFSSQWSNIHLYNGSDTPDSLINWYVGPTAKGLVVTNYYNDNGVIELHSYDHQFSQIRTIKTSNSNYAAAFRLVAEDANETGIGLFIDGVKLSVGYPYTLINGNGTWATKKQWVLRGIYRTDAYGQEEENPYQNTTITQTGKNKWSDDGLIVPIGGAEYPSMNFTQAGVKAGYAAANKHADSNSYVSFTGAKARSSNLSVQPIAGTTLCEFKGIGSNGSALAGGSGELRVIASENWTPSAMGTSLFFNLTDTGATSSAGRYVMTSGEFKPAQDNVRRLGTPATRWTEVFATNGTINTSDERLKTGIQDLDTTLLDAWAEVPKKSYKWVDSSDGKTQVGVIAQDIVKAFAKYGIDALDYGLINYDEEADRYGVNYAQASVLDSALALRERKTLEERIAKLEALLPQ